MCVWTSSKSWKCLLFTHFISLQVTFHFPVSFCSSSMFFYHLCSTQFYPNREVSFFKQKEKQKHKTLYQPVGWCGAPAPPPAPRTHLLPGLRICLAKGAVHRPPSQPSWSWLRAGSKAGLAGWLGVGKLRGRGIQQIRRREKERALTSHRRPHCIPEGWRIWAHILLEKMTQALALGSRV